MCCDTGRSLVATSSNFERMTTKGWGGQSDGHKVDFKASDLCTWTGNNSATVVLRNKQQKKKKNTVTALIPTCTAGHSVGLRGIDGELLLLTWSQESVKRECDQSVCSEMLTQIKQGQKVLTITQRQTLALKLSWWCRYLNAKSLGGHDNFITARREAASFMGLFLMCKRKSSIMYPKLQCVIIYHKQNINAVLIQRGRVHWCCVCVLV